MFNSDFVDMIKSFPNEVVHQQIEDMVGAMEAAGIDYDQIKIIINEEVKDVIG